ncbi:MAG: sulfotransferase domain-containing protein [Candidatus Binatia bacterium]
MRRPDFFIVGAPKCGTTAMIEYLKQHPEVFIPDRKELDFFGSDLVFKGHRLTEEEYLSFFARAKMEKRAGEGSVWYLHSTTAASEIKKFSPFARIIIMLRNPLDMMYSFHSQRVYNGNEDIENFAAALDAEAERKRGSRLPHGASDLFGWCYRDVATYTKQVERYFRRFGREHVRVIIYDDFANDTGLAYRVTCQFLDVGSDFQPDFRIVNTRKRVRSKALRDFMRRPHPTAGWLFRGLGLRPDRNDGYKGWLRRLNSSDHSLRPMDPVLRRQLQREFEPEVRQLSALLGRDLTHWCKA